MAKSKLADLSMDFAVKTVKCIEKIKKHPSIINQLERSATSIGANIREANYAQSNADFISKLTIALKECYETEYWLELLCNLDLLLLDEYKLLNNDCKKIRYILISAVNKSKKSNETAYKLEK